MILVDTSLWIESFRAVRPLDLETLVDFHDIVTCLPVIQEVLQGFDDERPYRLARSAMLALPVVESPLGGDVFDRAVEIYRVARRAGVTVRSSVDCLIAACAIKNDLELVHCDRDFPAIAKVSPLRERRIPA